MSLSFLLHESIVGRSLSSSAEEEEISVCALNREQRGRLPGVKMRKSLTNRKRQNDRTHSSESIKLFRFLFYSKNAIYRSEALL